MWRVAATAVTVAALSAGVPAQTLPEGDTGIAAKYPGDRGIEKHGAVVFVEKFNERSLNGLFNRWQDVKEREGMSFSRDVPEGSGDGRSLLTTHIGGRGTGSYLTHYLKGYTQLYARWYVKFDPKCNPIHHFGPSLAAKNPLKPYGGGHAGERPPGDQHAHASLEPHGRSWTWGFYSYWHEMRPCPPRGQYFGNVFTWGVPGKEVVRDKWICVEIMMKMNDPVGEHNGELAFWLDGKLIRHQGKVVSHLGKGFPTGRWTHDKFCPDTGGQPFEGFQWRTTENMRILHVKTGVYITTAPRGYVSKIWFDNLVVAKEYIGPLATKKSSGPPGRTFVSPPGW